MQLAKFLVEAVVLGKQSPNQLVRQHPISHSWFYELLARYRRDGPAALEPRAYRPASCPHQVDQAVVEAEGTCLIVPTMIAVGVAKPWASGHGLP